MYVCYVNLVSNIHSREGTYLFIFFVCQSYYNSLIHIHIHPCAWVHTCMHGLLCVFSYAWMAASIFVCMDDCMYGSLCAISESWKLLILTLYAHSTMHAVIHTCSSQCTQKCTQLSMHTKIHAAIHSCNHALKYACKRMCGRLDGCVCESSYYLGCTHYEIESYICISTFRHTHKSA